MVLPSGHPPIARRRTPGISDEAFYGYSIGMYGFEAIGDVVAVGCNRLLIRLGELPIVVEQLEPCQYYVIVATCWSTLVSLIFAFPTLLRGYIKQSISRDLQGTVGLTAGHFSHLGNIDN